MAATTPVGPPEPSAARLSGERLVRDASRDGVTAAWAKTLFLAPFVGGAACLTLFVIARPSYYLVLREDQVVEWGQFGFCAFTAVVAVVAAIRFRGSDRRGLALVMVAVTLAMVVLAGEEISWGQRVLGVVTPENLSAVNRQAEMNVHNIDAGVDIQSLFKISQVILGLVAAALTLRLRSRTTPGSASVWYVLAPPMCALPGFVAIAAYRIFMLVANIPPVIVFQEYAELTLYFSLAITSVAYATRAGGSRGAVPSIAAGIGVVVVTVAFAVASSGSGVLPGNIPGISPGRTN